MDPEPLPHQYTGNCTTAIATTVERIDGVIRRQNNVQCFGGLTNMFILTSSTRTGESCIICYVNINRKSVKGYRLCNPDARI